MAHAAYLVLTPLKINQVCKFAVCLCRTALCITICVRFICSTPAVSDSGGAIHVEIDHREVDSKAESGNPGWLFQTNQHRYNPGWPLCIEGVSILSTCIYLGNLHSGYKPMNNLFLLWHRLNAEARKLISTLGSSYINSLSFRDNWVFVGGKGIKTKSPFEQVTFFFIIWRQCGSEMASNFFSFTLVLERETWFCLSDL